MKGKKTWLNGLLVLALLAGGWELRRRWLAAEAKKQMLLAQAPALNSNSKPAAPPSVPTGLAPAQYFEVAERFLFAKDRNPMVVVEEKAPPPPPPPMPPLPNVFGVMDLGLGPTVFMSVGTDGQKGYKVGETVGEFTLTAASSKEVTFTWKDKTVTTPLDELVARSKNSAPAQSAQAAPPPPANPRMPDFTPPPPPKVPENVKPEPGTDIGMDRRGCVPGDTSPTGTVVDGWRKTSTNYAFGPICYWERVR
ncbi:MAG: hypothetical protein NW208_10440 [Bryobacter sp.]|nr:hypothetical protein [Bryobacter sp.]